MSEINKIGKKIEALRIQKNITLEQLSERCGFSLEVLAMIESDKSIPSLGHLIKIARVLGVRLGTFIDDVNQTGPVITRQKYIKQGVSFSNKNSGGNGNLDFFPLANDKPDRAMEPFLVDIHPKETTNITPSSHEGEEFIYVLKGKVEISYGKNVYLLNEGDSIYYDSLIEHIVYAADHAPARILGVVYSPV